MRRANQGAVHGIPRNVLVASRHGLGEPEVEQFCCSVCGDHNVRGRQVPM